MSDINETVAPLATEAGQDAIVQAINNISSFSYAVRAENAATTATQKASDASNSAADALAYRNAARNWATKMDTYVDTETITIPPEQEGEEPTTETINLYSARYYAALAQDIYNNMSFDSVPTENSTNMVNSGVIYNALNLKADKSDTYTKTEVDTAIGNVQSSLIFDNLPTQNSNNLVKSGGIYSALDLKADKSTTYTKTETDTQISTAISNLVNSAPSTLDTLEELANALGDDPNFATTIATQLGNKADSSSIPTKVSDLTNDSGFITSVAWNDISSKPTFATVATSGDYDDLTNKPTIPSAYTLPTASAGTLGGIKVGTNLSIDNNGVLSASSSGDVTTNTDQNITGTKTFVGSKKVGFKQSTANDKLGFTLYSNTGTERGYLEFNPTNTVDGITGLMTLGNYATSAAGLTQVGFRRYSNISGASGAYNLLMPMVADAKSPFSLTTTYQNFYLPLGFTDGTTTVKTAKSGLVNISSLLPANITVDSSVTQSGANPVTGAGIYMAIQSAINSITNANGVSY